MTLVQTSHAASTASSSAPRGLDRVVELSVGDESQTLPWHVLHTRSRQEKALARSLDAAGIHCELPLIQKIRMYGHRKRVVQEPLFTNYVFVQGTAEATYFAMSTKRVASVIPVPDQDAFVRDLASIRLAQGQEATAYQHLLAAVEQDPGGEAGALAQQALRQLNLYRR